MASNFSVIDDVVYASEEYTMEQLLVNKLGDPLYLPWNGDESSSFSLAKKPTVNSPGTEDNAPSAKEFNSLFSYSAIFEI